MYARDELYASADDTPKRRLRASAWSSISQSKHLWPCPADRVSSTCDRACWLMMEPKIGVEEGEDGANVIRVDVDGYFSGRDRHRAVSGGRDFQFPNPRQAIPSRCPVRILPGDALRLVRRHRHFGMEGSHLLWKMVRPLRSQDSRRDQRSGRRVSHQWRRTRVYGSQAWG